MKAPAAARELRVAAPCEPGPSLRKAALLLHAMPGRDRDWLLGQLPEADRKALVTLLAELATLGIPVDRGLLDEALAAGEPAAPASPPGGDAPDSLARLRGADAGQLAVILRGEPAVLIARLLRVEAWPWRRAVLTQLGSAARRHVEQALLEDRGELGQAFRARLLDVLAQRVDAAANGAAGWSWLRRWRGGRR